MSRIGNVAVFEHKLSFLEKSSVFALVSAELSQCLVADLFELLFVLDVDFLLDFSPLVHLLSFWFLVNAMNLLFAEAFSPLSHVGPLLSSDFHDVVDFVSLWSLR